MKRSNQVLSQYFHSIDTFAKIPSIYQEKIISFFIENRHYMVDPIDVKEFLKSGTTFSIYNSFAELQENILNKPINGILACKRVYSSIEWLAEWSESICKLSKDEIPIIFLTHTFELPTDLKDEWYIISY